MAAQKYKKSLGICKKMRTFAPHYTTHNLKFTFSTK